MKPTEEVRCCWHCLWVTQFWKNLSAGLLLTQNPLGRGFIHHRVCLSNDRAPPELFPSLLASTRALTKNHQARQPAQGNKWASREIGTWPREQVTGKGKHYPSGNRVFKLRRVTGPMSHWGRQSSLLTVSTGPVPHGTRIMGQKEQDEKEERAELLHQLCVGSPVPSLTCQIKININPLSSSNYSTHEVDGWLLVCHKLALDKPQDFSQPPCPLLRIASVRLVDLWNS